MKKKHLILIGVACLVLLVIQFTVPQKAVESDYRIFWVEVYGRNVFDELDDSALEQLTTALKETKCTRWKNPMGPFPVRKDTVVVSGMDSQGPKHFYLVGSKDRYAVNDYILRNGEQLLQAVMELLA